MEENTKNAIELLHQENTGILSTHSLELPGYPFGSVTPYALDKNFNPIILVSDLAEHTKNMDASCKVSLTITEQATEVVKQALGRYTYVGDAQRIDNNSDDYKEISQIYLRYFPSAKNYFEAHNFYFYRINFIRGRYIAGFGKIFWIDQQENVLTNAFSEEESQKIITHMNRDHLDSLVNYCSYYKSKEVEDPKELSMVGIYQYGFDLLYRKEKIHFVFSEGAQNSEQARERLVSMAKEARG